MFLSPIGRIVDKEWNRTPLLRQELNLIMDDYVIMPDHIHGIIIYRDARPGVSIKNKQINRFGPQRNNIPSIIRGIKSSVTKQSRTINPKFAWQTGYYVHIIRNKCDYERIVKYIKENPENYEGK